MKGMPIETALRIIIDFLNLPNIPADTIFGNIGFYAEVIFLIFATLLIINLILKFFRREEFFTGWTTFLIIIIPASLIIFIIIWLIPQKIEHIWNNIRPHM